MVGTLGAGPRAPFRAEVPASRRTEGSQNPSRGRRCASVCEEAAFLFETSPRPGLPLIISFFATRFHIPSPPAKLRFSKYGDIFRSEVFYGGLCLEPFGGGALGSVLRRSELFMFECELKLLDGEFVFFFFLTLCRGMFETLVL